MKQLIRKKIEVSLKSSNNKKQNEIYYIYVLSTIIVFLFIILIMLCFRVGRIGYNYLSIWDTKHKTLTIENKDLKINTNTKINIFNNNLFENKKIIAPMSKGKTEFIMKNNTNEDVEYHFRFVDEMNNFVNMKYRLKMDNVYIRGNKNEYISIDNLDVENVILPKDSISIYTLEWFWESEDEKDTYVASQENDQSYTLNLYIFSQAYQKGGKND